MNWERRAFQKEIDLAIAEGHPEMVKKLEELLDEQIQKIREAWYSD